MTFFCSKCGCRAPAKLVPHYSDGKGGGPLCNYEPVELEPVTEEQARGLLNRWGYDISKEGKEPPGKLPEITGPEDGYA